MTVNEQQVPLNEEVASGEAAPETQLGEKEGKLSPPHLLFGPKFKYQQLDLCSINMFSIYFPMFCQLGTPLCLNQKRLEELQSAARCRLFLMSVNVL